MGRKAVLRRLLLELCEDSNQSSCSRMSMIVLMNRVGGWLFGLQKACTKRREEIRHILYWHEEHGKGGTQRCFLTLIIYNYVAYNYIG